jgi:hypothetical protein
VIPTPYRWAALALSLAACYGIGYVQATHTAEVERAKIEAVASATDARYRKLETEVASAQSAYVQSWTAARDQSRADWLRLKATSAGRVPVVCSESGGAATDRGDGMEAASAAGDRDLLPALVAALERGEEIERTLLLCQSELRQCAALR